MEDFITEDFTECLLILGYYNIKTFDANFTADYTYGLQSVKKIRAYAPKDTELIRIAKELQELQRQARYDVASEITATGRRSQVMICSNRGDKGLITDRLAIELEPKFLKLHEDLALYYRKELDNDDHSF